MANIVQIRNMKLGEGLPKICVPLTDANAESLKHSLANLDGVTFDLVEWRADFYNDFQNPVTCTNALSMIRKALGDTPILFTIRTDTEGGQADISTEEYAAINEAVIQSGLADMVDVELTKGDSVMKGLVAVAHRTPIRNPDQDPLTGTCVKVVGSRHDFNKTPSKDFIVDNLCKMQELGADVAKFAVMPQCERDVLTLLDATMTMKEQHPDTPVITMSMGRLGALSRICGTLCGSALTFGTVGRASAPGQLPADLLKTILENLA